MIEMVVLTAVWVDVWTSLCCPSLIRNSRHRMTKGNPGGHRHRLGLPTFMDSNSVWFPFDLVDSLILFYCLQKVDFTTSCCQKVWVTHVCWSSAERCVSPAACADGPPRHTFRECRCQPEWSGNGCCWAQKVYWGGWTWFGKVASPGQSKNAWYITFTQ